MVSKHIYALALIFSAHCAISQFSEKPDYYNLIMPVSQQGQYKECLVYQYFPHISRDTLLVRKWILDSNGRILMDEIGNPKIGNAFAVDRNTFEADRSIVFEYDSIGKLISESTLGTDSTIRSTSYFYDTNGRLTKQEFWTYARKIKAGVDYSDSGCLKEKIADSLLESNYSWYCNQVYEKFTYSETGLLLKIEKILTGMDFPHYEYQFEYNENGAITREFRIDRHNDNDTCSVIWNYREYVLTVSITGTNMVHYYHMNSNQKVTVYWCEMNGEKVINGGFQYHYDSYGRLVREEMVDPITEDLIYLRIYRYR